MKVTTKGGLGLVLGIMASVTLYSSANASVVITWADADPIPVVNDFQSNLAALGLNLIATSGASIVADAPSTITFEFLGSESGFSDTFTTPSFSYTENSGFENHFLAPIYLGDLTFAGPINLAGLLNFTSSGGAGATVGDDGFGIFLGDQISGQPVSTFYFGYDDEITPQDNDHDDFIVRATVRPAVPEPATWAMMLIGFGGIGWTMRQRRKVVHQKLLATA